jgi:alkanesulfonate monooxygenase SsuD/methylene tetrahydromethanopterin reductase-like flavin-dependent oxidoreductase (luciferase family)
MCFISLKADDLDDCRAQVALYRDLAAREYGRTVQLWSSAYVIQRDTEAEARAYEDYLLENADQERLAHWNRMNRENSKSLSEEQRQSMKRRFVAGVGGYPLVGTPEMIVERLRELSAAGLNGLVLTWIDVENGMDRFIAEVLPLIEQAGLRKPHRAT